MPVACRDWMRKVVAAPSQKAPSGAALAGGVWIDTVEE
jgi:hypothetical protein